MLAFGTTIPFRTSWVIMCYTLVNFLRSQRRIRQVSAFAAFHQEDGSSVQLSHSKEGYSGLHILTVVLPSRPTRPLTEDLFSLTSCNLLPLSQTNLIYQFIIRLQSAPCTITLPDFSLQQLGLPNTMANSLTVIQQEITFRGELSCWQQQSYSMKSFVSCVVSFASQIAFFNVNHVNLVGGKVVTFSILNDEDEDTSQVFLYIEMDAEASDMQIGLLYGAAYNDLGHRSMLVDSQSILVSNGPFRVTLEDRSSDNPCLDGVYELYVIASNRLPGFSEDALILSQSTVKEIARVDDYT